MHKPGKEPYIYNSSAGEVEEIDQKFKVTLGYVVS